jgi:transposase-like protein
MSKLKSIEELFEGRHFDREVIIVCVRWYLRFKLSLRDLVEMMAEHARPHVKGVVERHSYPRIRGIDDVRARVRS